MALAEGYVIEEKVPSGEEHYSLRLASGLSPPPRPENEVSLRNTWYGVTVRLQSTGEAVGMGRIIGDGAFFLTVVDICTLPQHQRKGLAGQVMQRLLKYVDEHAPNAHLNLLADPPGVALYKRHGFFAVSSLTPMYRSEHLRKQGKYGND